MLNRWHCIQSIRLGCDAFSIEWFVICVCVCVRALDVSGHAAIAACSSRLVPQCSFFGTCIMHAYDVMNDEKISALLLYNSAQRNYLHAHILMISVFWFGATARARAPVSSSHQNNILIFRVFDSMNILLKCYFSSFSRRHSLWPVPCYYMGIAASRHE